MSNLKTNQNLVCNNCGETLRTLSKYCGKCGHEVVLIENGRKAQTRPTIARFSLALIGGILSAAVSTWIMQCSVFDKTYNNLIISSGPAFSLFVLLPLLGLDVFILIGAILANGLNFWFWIFLKNLTIGGSALLALVLLARKRITLKQVIINTAAGVLIGIFIEQFIIKGNTATNVSPKFWFEMFLSWQVPTALLIAYQTRFVEQEE